MQGFQPSARRLAQPPQHLADGGAVGFGARGLNQLRELVPKVAAMGFPQQAKTPAPAPVSDPRAAQLMAMIPQMEAMGFKQKPQMLARGGMVRGPGTGTSDSITDEAEPGTYIMPADSTAAIGPSALEKMGTVPVRLSDGEFKIPPEKVMAIGEAVLKLMKDATHTPVNGEDGGQTDAEMGEARGFNPADRMAQMPEQMYADGGAVGYPMQRLDIGQWAQEQEQARDDMARFNARQAIERDDQAAADAEAVAQSEEFKRRQQMPEQALANGGMVENNVTRVGNSYSGGNVGGSITVNGAAPAGTFSENPAGRMAAMPTPSATPTPSAPVGAQPATAALARPPAAPVSPVAATPAPPAPMGWAERNAQRNAEVSAASITNRPEWSRAPRQAPAGAGFQPSAERLGAQAMLEQPRRYADGGMVHRLPLPPGYKPRGYFGGDTVVDDRQQQALANQTAMYVRGAQEAAATPAPTPVAAPAQPAGALTRAAGAGRGFTNPAAVTPGPAVEAMSGGLGFEPNAVTRTGNSYTGPANISGDVTINGGGPRNGGQISAQNMGAADSLARRGAAERMAEMPNAPQQVQAPMVRHSGNDWQARKDLENARTSALSITNRPEWSNTGMNRFRGGQAGPSTDVAAYNAMLSNDLALRGAQPGLDQAAMKENAENQRSSLRERGLAAQALAAQRGEMDRTLIKEQGDNARTGLTTQATLDAAKIKAQQELAEQQRKSALKNPETSTALRKEFEGLPEVKNYKQALPAYKGIEDAVKRNTPMSDINIVYGIAKLYDPNSVVREGEYATVANAPNIPERVKGWVQYATNGGKLTPEVKKQIMDEASSRMMSFQNEFEGSSARYRDIAERSNADPTLVISSDYKPAVAKKEEQAVSPQIAELQRRAASNPALAARLKEMGY